MESSPCSQKGQQENEKKNVQIVPEFGEVYAAWSGFIWTSVLLFLAEQKCATSSGSVLHVLHKPLMFIADQKCKSPFRVSSSNFMARRG